MKVVLLGFGRTGTKSLTAYFKAQGLKILEFKEWRTNRYKLLEMYKRNRLTDLFYIADRCDLLEDFPWPLLYKELYERYPEAKFILSYRPPKEWLTSIIKHTKNERGPSENKRIVFGSDTPTGNESTYLDKYVRHVDEVREYFSGCPSFIEVNLKSENVAKTLSEFLGVPEIPIPHRNRSNA